MEKQQQDARAFRAPINAFGMKGLNNNNGARGEAKGNNREKKSVFNARAKRRTVYSCTYVHDIPAGAILSEWRERIYAAVGFDLYKRVNIYIISWTR